MLNVFTMGTSLELFPIGSKINAVLVLVCVCLLQVKGQVDEYSGNKPGETIVEQAEKLNADHVIMGTRGLTGMKKFFLGSVSNYVVQNCGVPVSVIPKKEQK